MSKKTPTIGLALGSGSARGWSHIGIIQALNDLNIKPDVISGCSIGALVGSAYAMDALDNLDTWVRSLNFMDVIGFFDISLTGGGVAIGERLFNVFKKNVGDGEIESLPIPFAAVATELSTGREIWFREGSILQAVRASVAYPGLFTPANYNGSFLVDGGLVNPVPVSVCRAMGADIVIAVNLNSQLLKRNMHNNLVKEIQQIKMDIEKNDVVDEEGVSFFNMLSEKRDAVRDRIDSFLSKFKWDDKNMPGLFNVVAGSIHIMQDRITKSRMAGDPPDILLEPKLGNMGLLEFYKAAESIEEGKKCVLRSKDLIQETIGI